MSYFTARNTVILALVQVGVLTFGMLAAAVSLKWHSTFRIFRPTAMTYLADYGWLALPVPLAWVLVASHILQKEGSSDRARALAVGSGMLLVVVFLGLVWYAVAREWLSVG